MKNNRIDRLRRSWKGQIRRCIAGLVCLILMLSLSPQALAENAVRKAASGKQTVNRAQTSRPDAAGAAGISSAYVLQVVTGSSETNNLLYFCVRYEDTAGVNRMEYIFPEYGELGEGYAKAVNKIHRAGSALTEAEYGLEEVKRWGYRLTGYDVKKALEPMEKNEFYFEPRYTLKRVISVDIMCRYEENGKLSWPCQSLAVYRVDKLYDLDMLGHFSDQYYLEYEGICVALMVRSNTNGITADNLTESLQYNFSWGSSDTLFRVEAYDGNNRSTRKAYELVYPESNEACSSLKSYDSHNASRYLLKMDIADEYGAGVEALAAKYGTRGVNSWESALDAFDFYEAKDYTDSSRKRSGWMYNQGFCEALAVEVEYTDTMGAACVVAIPAVLSFLDWSLTFGTFDCTTQILGLLQQGESLAFDAVFPNFASLSEVRLRFGSAGAKSSTGLSGSTQTENNMSKESMSITGFTIYNYDIFRNIAALETYRNEYQDLNVNSITDACFVKSAEELPGVRLNTENTYRFEVTEDGEGVFSLIESGNQVNASSNIASYSRLSNAVYSKSRLEALEYDSSVSYAYAKVEGGFIRLNLEGDPLYYYTCSSSSGQLLTQSSAGNDQHYFKVPLSAYTGKEALEPRYGSDCFLLVLETDAMEAAGTTSDFTFKMHYHSLDGQDKYTEPVSIKTAVQSYAGYWPGINGDASFTYSASSGNSLYCVFTAKNVSYFTGLTITMERFSDDYQLSGIKIYELTSLGKRSGHWEDVYTPSGGMITDRVFTREYNKDRDISPTLQEAVLFQSGETKTITFVSGGTTKTEEDDVDWSDIQYSMTYSEAMQNLGFTKQRQTYSVKVKVSDEVVNGEVNEDCGSHNYFYFRLLFENGSSGYVLANQQLGADGFRTGAEETFTIYTNQNYGRLTSINLIPEDVSENADSFDKLRIDWIQVVREDEGGFSTTWTADVNDWVSIDYHDEGERNSTTGQIGRTETELCTPYLITNEGYSMKLLFAIHTNSYENTPFMGTVEGTVEYIDSNGNMASTDFNMIEGIYNFAKKTSSTSVYTLAGKSVSAYTVDRSWMLTEDHTDRFIVPVMNIAELIRLKLTISSETSGYWNVSGVNVYQIKGDGKLVLNQDSEYVTTAELEAVTGSTSEDPYRQWYPANGAAQTLTVEFAQNDIQVDLSKNTWNSVITYEPKSKDDTLNIYAHVNKSAYPLDSYELVAAANYQVEQVTELDQNGLEKTYADQQKQVSVTMRPDQNNMMFTAIGVKAAGITEFNSLTLRIRDELVQYTEIDYAYVEHVRSGVILDTYYLDFGNRNAENTITAVPQNDTAQKEERQELTFMLTDDTTATSLLSQTNDIAVSFTYTTKYDPTGQEYKSRNIFLSENQVARLKAGEISTVEFTEHYVKDITAITFTAMGTARNMAAVKNAYMVTYGGEEMENWYSFGTEMNSKMNLNPVTMSCTGSTSGNLTLRDPSTVGDLKLVFYTAAASSMTESGTASPIRLTVVYYDDKDTVHSVRYEDIHDYLTEGTFNTDGVATVRLLLSGFKEIRYIEVEPYDTKQAYVNASWTIRQVDYSACVNDVKPVDIKRGVNQTVQEGTGLKIGMSQIAVRLTASVLKEDGSFSDRRAYQSGIVDESATGILISEKQSIIFYPEITGSLDSVHVTCARVAVTKEGKTVTETDTESISYAFENGDIYSVTFVPTQSGDYRITVSSLEIGEIQVSVDISVTEMPEEPEPENEPEDLSDNADHSDETSPEESEGETENPESVEDIPADTEEEASITDNAGGESSETDQ